MAQTIAGILRKEISRAHSLYRVSKDSGVSHAPLHRFVHDENAGLSLDNIQLLMDYFDLVVVKKPARKTRRKV